MILNDELYYREKVVFLGEISTIFLKFNFNLGKSYWVNKLLLYFRKSCLGF